ncbi:MAG: A/G-specific adenine glycosylase, partial [Bacteroidales bacterium]
MDFTETLLAWYMEHRRELPWQSGTNPYYIWVSEIILQQTRVSQGLEYYHRFIAAFPTVQDLARAKEDEVLKVWQGLGYYSRARNMHRPAQT